MIGIIGFEKPRVILSGIVTLIIILSIDALNTCGIPDDEIDSGKYINPPCRSSNNIAYYNFNYIYIDNNISYVTDDSGRGKDGRIFGCTQEDERDENIGDAALSFDGINDYIRINDSPDFNFCNFVISAMIKPNELAADYIPICSKYEESGNNKNGFIFYLDHGQLGFTAYNATSYITIIDSDGDDLRDNDWHYVFFESYYGNGFSLYIDPSSGSYGEVESTSQRIYPGTTGTYFYIGREDKTNTFFDGIIDCIYAYEIPWEGLPPPTPDDSQRMWGFQNVGYWPMDEGTDNVIYVNDMVRYDYHSYGINGGDEDAVDYTSSPTCIPGTNCLVFYGGEDPGWIEIDDSDNYLDFACPQNGDQLYIEFWFLTEADDEDQMLIEKWDWSVIQHIANGYRLFIDYTNPTSVLKFQVANSNTVSSVTADGSIQNNIWYHVWAWADSGILNIWLESQNGGPGELEQSSSQNGIGATTSPLVFGCGKPNYVIGGWPLIGEIDDVVIGRLYPI